MSAHPAKKTRHPKPEMLELRPGKPDVAEIVQDGLRALDQREFSEAAKSFRRALSMAPFRSDIRELLDLALQERVSGRRPEGAARTAPNSPVEMPAIGRAERAPRGSVLAWMRKGIWIGAAVVALLLCGGLILLATQRGSGKAQGGASEKEVLDTIARAQIYFGDGRYDDAIAVLDGALKAPPGQSAEVKALQASFQYKHGLVLSEKRDYSGAIERLRKAVDLAPDNTQYHYELGWAIHLLGMNLRTAAPKDAIKTKDTSGKARECAAEAQGIFQGILRIDPNHLAAANGLARTALALGQKDAAIAAHAELMRISPKSLEAKSVGQELRSRGWLTEETASKPA